MSDITKNRLLTWIMWFIPILLIGFPFVILWTIIQLCLCTKEREDVKNTKDIEEKKYAIKKLKNKTFIEEKKKYAEENGLKYVIIGNEIIFTGKKYKENQHE